MNARSLRRRRGLFGEHDTGRHSVNGTAASQGNSPIHVGSVTQCTLFGLGGSRVFVAVTAYDTLGRESWYSNEVKGPWRAFLPLVLGDR